MKENEQFQLKIDNIAFGGYGVGRIDRRVFFVKGAYPGETAEIETIRVRRGLTYGRCINLLEKSPYRQEAPCDIFQDCGGCSWQDIDYEKQFEFKTLTVLDSLEHIGKLENLPEIEPIRAENEFRYRNKMEFTFGGEPGQIFAGLHRQGRYDMLIPARGCMLMPEVGNRIIESVEKSANRLGLSSYDPNQKNGLLRHLTMRFSETEGKYLAAITVFEPATMEIREIMEDLKQNVEGMAGGAMIVNTSPGDSAQGEIEPLIGEGYIYEDIHGIRFRISYNSFFQTNTVMARKLYSKIAEYAEIDSGQNVLDLYCGTGTIAQILAKDAGKVIGVELVPAAIDDARLSAERNEIHNVDFICGSVQKTMPQILLDNEVDTIVFDPPRAGIPKKTLKKVVDNPPRRIVYTSCNPTTLARDLKHLNKKYEIEKIAVVDMFPQTYHVETVVKLNCVS